MPILGCIADDFTGASDAASFLQKGGMKVILYNGIPSASDPVSDADAYVIALKSRTQETNQAVSDSLCALDFLLSRGVSQIYLKYCSTFDSTPQGNIGPIADAVMEKLNQPYTILCPALPVNGRTVSHGQLFVNGVPLHESSMKNHPLTPMWDSRISVLMKDQSQFPCFAISSELSDAQIFSAISELKQKYPHFYIIPDFVEPEDAKRLVRLYGALPLLTGGSGLLTELARRYEDRISSSSAAFAATDGPALLLAGSCSQATLSQIQYYQSLNWSSIKIDPQELVDQKTSAREIWKKITENPGKQVLVYTSDTKDAVRRLQENNGDLVAGLIEQTLAQLAVLAVQNGYKRIVVAGGETSGAVTKALYFHGFYIGDSIAPGVPVLIPLEAPDVRLVLKSGNFGATDFFKTALEHI